MKLGLNAAHQLIVTSSSQAGECSDHAESASESLPRNKVAQRVLDEGDTYSASSEFVQKDDRRVGNHKDCTVSGLPNKSSSDHRGDIKPQSSQDVGYDNDTGNSELLPQNEEEDSRMQVLPRFRKMMTSDSLNKKAIKDVPCHSTFRSPSSTCHSQEVIPVAQQYRHLSIPTTEPKSGSSSAPRSLLQKVLSRSGASIPLKQFSFREDEIEFVDIIGESFEEECHARMFRITAGGRNFALKHKYWESDMSQSLSQYPLPNQRFDHESTTYARTAHLQDLPTSPVPKCYGYVELTKIPQARSRHQRNPFRSTWFSTAAYLDFLIQEEDRRGTENQQRKRYFRDKPPSACILRGIVLEEIPSGSLERRTLSHPSKLINSGRESLARLHECGVTHGDVGDLRHALVAKSGRVVWVGFANSYAYRQGALQKFSKRAETEMRLWDSLFVKRRPRPRKQQA
ncbi:uncharacterized protein RCO7_11324 [Rhynchosporium graminicola]|uniref:Uncharacterized protein n=1 Tax=Rhynchosporium graminicola TaxID=2792576 RepID=A0A1E1KY30_9HELO|nr:uncharacterized protein RCO7_11324 [Rhynchosporium commune]